MWQSWPESPDCLGMCEYHSLTIGKALVWWSGNCMKNKYGHSMYLLLLGELWSCVYEPWLTSLQNSHQSLREIWFNGAPCWTVPLCSFLINMYSCRSAAARSNVQEFLCNGTCRNKPWTIKRLPRRACLNSHNAQMLKLHKLSCTH